MKNITWWKKSVLTIMCLSLLVSPMAVNAQAVVTDPVNLGERITEFFYGIGQNLKKTMGAVAYKNMLSAFLSKVAYDAAIWVSSAGTGQQTLVYTQPWDEYLVDAADGALGEYVSSLATEAGFNEFNVCAPASETVRLNLALGLETSLINPEEPDCKISELGENWADVIETEELADYFVLSFDPAENEIGTFLTLKSTFGELSAAEEEAAKFQRETDGPVSSKTGTISQYIQTPGDWINDSFKSSVEDTKTPYKTYTGEVLADTLNIFSSTLFSKLVQRLQTGFVPTDTGTSLSDLISGSTGGTTGGVAAAKATYATLNQPTFNPGGEVDSAYKLVEEGIIDQTFQLAIENQWQLQEFIDYLNDNVEGGADNYLFGVESDQLSSPSAGITRRGIYLLKKYRIVPVGWQIAADLIYANRDSGDFDGISLGDLADCADGNCLFNNCGVGDYEYSEFCKLVDPDWVLKSPQAYCAKESYGLSTAYDDFLDQDGNEYNQDEHVLTREQECVDEMTCINEDDEGNCYDYGYCVKDERTYQFEGEGCSEEVASCQGYERQSDETQVNYLTNTLNYGDCNSDNAIGCTWYCQNEGSIEGNWGCLNATQSYAECDESTGTEEGYCYCQTEETCDVSIYDETCTVSTGETCTLSEVCSPENENYAGTYCTCTLSDSGYMDVGDSDGIVSTDTYGWDCSLDDTATCETTSDTYFTYLTCDSATCTNNCTIYEGEYSCTNTDGEECYIAIEDNGPEDLATVYLNDEVSSCSSDNAGCTEYIKARENNILFNSSFEDYDYIDSDNDLGVCSNLELLDPLASPYCSEDSDCDTGTCEGWNGGSSAATVEVNDTTAITATSYGASFLHLSGTGGILTQTINYDDYALADRTFVISLQAYASTACDLYVGLSGVDNNYRTALTASLTGDSIWTTYTSDPITFPTDETGTELTLGIANICDAYIDAVQLEEASSVSSYVDYGSDDLVYLNEDVVECQSSEVGCTLYTPTSGKFREDIPGVITNENSDDCTGTLGYADPDCSQCSDAYVGCDYYQEQPLSQTVPLAADTSSAVISAIGATTGTQSRLAINDRTGKYCYGDQSTSCFNNSDCGAYGPCLDSVSIVPSTATACSAAAVGCESYTNLGTVAEGGEGTEYYNYLKQCVTTADTEIDAYYSWEGSDESGYQLKSHTLKAATDGAPCTNLALTSEEYNASCIDGTVATANDCTSVYGTDADCVLYYTSDGDEFYRYESEVITVDDECIPLRNDNDGRTYYMLPDESTSCSSTEVGCREYRGSEGADVKLLIDDDFSDCSTGDWVASGSTALDAPSESVYVDDCSLTIADSYYPLYSTDDDGAYYPYLEEGNSYVVTFWAKGSDSVYISLDTDGDTSGDIYFTDYGSSTTATATSLDSADWQEYTLGPLFIDDVPTDTSNLVVAYAGTGYFDSFYLQESESQYLIQGSADLCQGYEGCQTYQDEDGVEYYLKSFARLCDEERVGCDIVYNSQNTSENPYAKRYNLSNEYDEDDLIIPTDEIDYLVLDGDNECSSSEKGCQTLGEPDVNEVDGTINSWETTYLINDPDSYDSILCQYQQLDCLEYESPYDGVVYFKDPGDKTCYFDSTANVWYKNGTTDLCDLFNPSDSPSQPMGSVCDDQSGDLEGEYCQEDDDCGAGRCISTNDDSGWVGTCENEDSGCTQYSDPYTGEELITNNSFEYDEVNNSTGSLYDEDDSLDGQPDYWQDLASYNFSGQVVSQEDVLTALGLSSSTSCEVFEMETAYTYHYSNSLKMDPAPGVDCVVLATNRIVVDPNETYNMGAHLYGMDSGWDIGLLFVDTDAETPSILTAENSQQNLVMNYADLGIETMGLESDEWEYFHGTIGYGKGIEFPEGTDEVWPYLRVYGGTNSAYIDKVSFKEEDDYYYLDYTIDGTEEGSVSGTTTDECITGINEGEGCLAFRDNTREDQSYLSSGDTCGACTYNHETDTCTGVGNACDSNVVIKVRPDRVCDQWIDCYYYNEVTSDDGSDTELECLGLGICEGLNDEGDCTDWVELPITPDGGDDLTYISQADAQSINSLDEIQDYSGYSKVGMIWPSITSCEGGYDDGEACDSSNGDTDCEDRGTCEYEGRIGTCSGGSLSGTVCSTDEDCHNEAQDGTCSGVFELEGYYPYAAMVEYGDLDEEVVENGDFEELYCQGTSKVDTDSKCIIDSHCNNTEIQSYNESATDGTCSTCTEIEEGTDYYCPNNYGSDGSAIADHWIFDSWQAEGNADLMVVQYSEDETYSGDSRYNQSDNIGDSFTSGGATYAQDWNNVLKANVSSGNPDGIKHTGLESSVVSGNTYTLSFTGKYLTGADDDDVLNVGLRHTDSAGDEYVDWFVKGDGMIDLVFVIENSGTSTVSFRNALTSALDDIESNMPDGVSYRAALVTSNSAGTNLVQSMETLDVFESSLSSLSSHAVIGSTCNLDALYDTVNDDVNGGSINYRSEADRVVVLITDAPSGESSSCDYRRHSHEISTDLLASEEAVYYIFSSSTYYEDYADIVYYVSGSFDYTYNSGSSDYSADMAEIVTNETAEENMEKFQMNTTWTDYTFGPLVITEKPEGEGVSTDLVIYQSSDSSGADFIIDDVSLLPTLEVNPDLDGISRDCRAYPESSSLSCSYYEGGGNYYRGWMGYCLEYDPEDKNNCLVWWPTDRIKGESFISSLRSEAGYSERSPVYNCLVSKGYAEVGFCADAEDVTSTYPWDSAAQTPTVDYLSNSGHDSAICYDDGDCVGSQVCFHGADIRTMVDIGTISDSTDVRYTYFNMYNDNFESHIYPTPKNDFTSYYGNYDIEALETSDYTVVTRVFNAAPASRYYNLADAGSFDAVSDGTYGTTHNSISIMRYPANPIERNIHISEVQRISFDPGKSGDLNDANSESKFFSPRALLDGNEINLINGEDDWDYGDGTDEEIYCQKHSTSSAEGVGCYWVKQYDDLADGSKDVIYTYAFSGWYEAGQTVNDCETSSLLEDNADNNTCNGTLSAQVQRVVRSSYYEENDDGYENPWNHLSDFGMDNYNDGSGSTSLANNFGGSTSGGYGTIDVNTEYFLYGQYPDTTERSGDWFSTTGSASSAVGGNIVSVMFDFDSEGYLDNIYALTWFGSEETGDAPSIKHVIAPSQQNPMKLTYYLREPCAVIAKSVDDDGSAYSWSTRISDTSYALPGSLNIYNMYEYVDDEPFGGIPPNELGDTPSDWNGTSYSSSAEMNNVVTSAPLVMEDGEIFNAGWPISCIGNCGVRVCSDDYSTPCTTDSDCDSSEDEVVCIGAGGVCRDAAGTLTGTLCGDDSNCESGETCYQHSYDEIAYGDGVTYDEQVSAAIDSALTRYKYLFANPLAIYTSDIDSTGYSWTDVISDVGFNSFDRGTMSQCSDNERTVNIDYTTVSDSTSEYCGVIPSISDEGIEVNGVSSGEVRADKSQKITLSFTSEVDQEQLPLEKIYIDWYGANWDQDWTDHDWGYGSSYHSYSWYSGCSTTSSNYCFGGTYSGSSDTCDYEGYCVYKPRVTLVDHWGWTSGQDGGSEHRSYYTAGYTLGDQPAYDEFEGVLLVSP